MIGAPPAANGVDFQLSVNAQGRLVTEEEFGEIVVATSADGGVTRLKDVARIELGAGEYALRSLLNNKPAVAIAVFQAPVSNALALSNDVRKTMAGTESRLPRRAWTIDIVYDPTRFVKKSIEAVVETLLEAILLVVLVVIVFLQTWRASVIPLAAVPVSIIGTFAFMLLFGFSINALSLFGLVLAIGIVVDDAIVVVENVERNIELGFDPKEATYKAMSEVSGPIIAIALTLCAVFIPIAFISGLTGQFYRQFALTIAISTVISAFNSLTLSPALAALLLRQQARRARSRLRASWTGSSAGSSRRFDRLFQRSADRYQSAVARVLNRKAMALAVYAVLIGADLRRLPGGAARLRAGAGQAVSGRLRATAGRGVARAHRRGDPQDVRDRHEDPGRAGFGGVSGTVDQWLHQRAQRRRRVFRPGRVRKAQSARDVGRRDRDAHQPATGRDPGCVHRRVPAAAGERPGHHRRVQARDRGPRQRSATRRCTRRSRR